jgi:nitroimidazol reductase NimA-like FMN-containing flavoprotein (pyridoxamine 5'-phosphate oxidase superfamily)
MLRDGRSVAVAVSTLVDLVASKTAGGHGANYRSVIAYGRGRQIVDLPEKRRVLEAMIERYFPGRSAPADYVTATDDELERVELTDIEIDEASAKMRAAGAMGEHDSDPDFPGSTFIRPVR